MTTHEVWLRNFEQVADAIPASWRTVDPTGLEWILPDHAAEPIVKMHRALALVGFANGWL
jgi:hypothetical protein